MCVNFYTDTKRVALWRDSSSVAWCFALITFANVMLFFGMASGDDGNC